MDRARRRPLPVLAIALVWIGASVASAQPVQDTAPEGPQLRSVWGDASNGSLLTLKGAGFGTHALEVRSGVGPQGWIESNRPGTTFDELLNAPGWDVGPSTVVAPVISDERAHSGAHSALSRVDFAANGGWQSVMRYKHRRPFRSLYATWWIYFDPIRYAFPTQWKEWRINDYGGVSDNCSDFVQSSRWDDGHPQFFQSWPQCMLDCPDGDFRDCMAKVVPQPYYPPLYGDPYQYMDHNHGGAETLGQNHTLPRQWCRFEIFVESGDMDTANGTFMLAITRPDQPRKLVDHWTGVKTHRSDCCRDSSDPWQWFLFQNYFDDDGGPFDKERADFFIDDIYLQFGTQARVELGNQPAYDECTDLEIQEPTSWKDDAITVKLNQGAFAPDQDAYFFVVTAEGTVSAGLPIRLR